MVSVRPSLPGDTWLLLLDLRAEEVAELAALGVTCEHCMRLGLALSDPETLFIAGDPAGMFGLMDFGAYDVLWGVFTRTIDQHPLAFLRFTRKWMQARTRPIRGYVDVRNVRAVQWFSWLGFTLSEPVTYGLKGELFRRIDWAPDLRHLEGEHVEQLVEAA